MTYLECTTPVPSHYLIRSYGEATWLKLLDYQRSEAIIIFQQGVFVGDGSQAPEYGAMRYTRELFIFCFRYAAYLGNRGKIRRQLG